METHEWTQQQLNKLISESRDFEEQAFYQVLQDTMTEQVKRIDQLQGEVDGRVWNTENW